MKKLVLLSCFIIFALSVGYAQDHNNPGVIDDDALTQVLKTTDQGIVTYEYIITTFEYVKNLHSDISYKNELLEKFQSVLRVNDLDVINSNNLFNMVFTVNEGIHSDDEILPIIQRFNNSATEIID